MRLLIVAFCLVHMAAVAAYLLPRNTPWRAFNLLAGDAFNMSRPYILSLSQWQKWDIFSPDPLRRVSRFTVDAYRNGAWHTLATRTFETLQWYERPKELKILGRLEEDWGGMVPNYLEQECKLFPEAAGLRIRLQAHSIVLPKDLPSLSQFSHMRLRESERTLGETHCSTLQPS